MTALEKEILLKRLSFEKEKEQALELLLKGLAHDFGNLLAIIRTNIELIKLCPPCEKIELYAERAQRALSEAQEMAECLLSPQKVKNKPYDLYEVIKSLTEPLFSGTQIKVAIDIPEEIVLPTLSRLEFIQILLNLLINAKEALPKGGTIYIGARNVLRKNRPFFQLIVKDDGLGIPEDKLSKIFHPGFSLKRGNRGLGLSIVASIVETYGGHIEVESAPYEGTTFIVYLPAREGFEAQETSETTEEGILTYFEVAPAKRILIVEDEKDLAESMAEALKQLGFKVELAKDPKEARKLYQDRYQKEEPFEVVITDCNLAEASGLELLSDLREVYPKAKFIVVSGLKDPELAKAAERNGAYFLTKPFRLEELLVLL